VQSGCCATEQLAASPWSTTIPTGAIANALYLSIMSAASHAPPFGVAARCERTSVPAGKSTLWASIRVDAKGKGLEVERAPLAIALVIDVSGSMKGDPIAHVVRSCELVAELLDERDRLAIVTFADHAGVRCGLTALDTLGRAAITAALRDVVADGSTNMHAGMEAGAGLLATAPAGLRRAMVVMSDGQPNRGLASATELAGFVQTLRPLGVSTLGFGIHHDENVLAAIAVAGSGRYAYVPDPIGARVDLARAALAHGGIVAEGLELELRPAAGVELLRVLPATQLRHGGSGVKAAIGDVFVDEDRLLALELALDLAGARGELAEIVIAGRSPDGKDHRVTATLVVDIHAGPHALDRDAQRDILLVRADASRIDARAQADRGAMPAAVSLLRDMIRQIEASDGFVRNDGSQLAELREQLEDEANNYERKGSNAEMAHMRKGTFNYVATATPMRSHGIGMAPGVLVGLTGRTRDRRFQLFTETLIGRSPSNEIPLDEDTVSRQHARILYVDGNFVLQDMGSTGGSAVNERDVSLRSEPLATGDIIRLGIVRFRFERK
jgi:Ca-activated chloride channel family protein